MASSSLTSDSPGPAEQCGSGAINVASFVPVKLSRDRNGNHNYESWKQQMLCLVESQGLVGFIDGKTPPPPKEHVDYGAWRRTDWLVKGWILGALSAEIVPHVAHFDSARKVWFDIESNLSKSRRAAHPPQPPQEWHKYLPLYRAAIRGDWDTAQAILERDPDALTARVSFTLETVLHVVIGTGKNTSFVAKLVDLMTDDRSLAVTDELGYTPLHAAALTGNFEAARILVVRLPGLLYVESNNKWLPLHLAAGGGHRQTLELLISHTRVDLPTNPFTGLSGLHLVEYLIDASFLDIALDIVEKYPHLAGINPVLRNTTLNRIALRGETLFSAEAQLNFWERLIYPCIQVEMECSHALPVDTGNQKLDEPPRWRKDVQKRHSTFWKVIKLLVPRIERVYEKKLMYEQALKLVKCLCKHMEMLRPEEASAICIDALRTAARLGCREVVEVIVATFPPAIHYRSAATHENFLHLAVRNRCEKVFNLIYQANNPMYHYSDKTDASGNSILHMAATLSPPHKLNLVPGAALQMQRELQWFKEVDKFVKPISRGRPNKAGKTPEMIFTEEHKELREEGEKWMKDTAASCSIVAALIITVVFVAGITVPGGYATDSGYPMLWESNAFTIFAVSDAVSLFTSTTSLLMFLSILTSSRYAEQDFLYALPKRLCVGLLTLFLSILSMMVAFGSTLYLVFGHKNAWVLILVAALTCLPITSFVLLQFPLLIDVVSSTYGRGIFGKQSNRPFH